MAGAMAILRPEIGLDRGAVLALLSGLLFAGYLILTRVSAQRTDPLTALFIQLSVGTALLTPFAIVFWMPLSLSEIGIFLCMGAVSAFCHYFTILAFKYGEASVLSVIVYLELVSASVIGYYVFGDTLGGFEVAGILLIVFAGAAVSLFSKARA